MANQVSSQLKRQDMSGDYHEKKMILPLKAHVHSWVKHIAESTGLTQPNVVNLVLEDASKKPSKEFVDQINRTKAMEMLKQMEIEDATREAEKQRLKKLLS